LGRFAPSGPTELAQVVSVTDGDTIRVLIDGEEYRLRYIGIDTPESVAPDTPVEPFALAAAEANAALVEHHSVVLEKDVSQTDRFDRLLRYVWLPPADGRPSAGWRLVNLELVRAGLAEAVDYPPDTKYSDWLAAAEAEARADGSGMWTSE
jgi:endonuclease YncB( thermonuclease family)